LIYPLGKGKKMLFVTNQVLLFGDILVIFDILVFFGHSRGILVILRSRGYLGHFGSSRGIWVRLNGCITKLNELGG